ncbi:hypothetical protein LguiA_012050 [Lonicera macranthoides]
MFNHGYARALPTPPPINHRHHHRRRRHENSHTHCHPYRRHALRSPPKLPGQHRCRWCYWRLHGGG